jgi:hypothetical protein
LFYIGQDILNIDIYFNDDEMVKRLFMDIVKKNNDSVELFSLSAIYTQEADSCSNKTCHELELKTDDAGGGRYYVLSTERWAFESVDEIVGIIEDFLKRVKDGENDD